MSKNPNIFKTGFYCVAPNGLTLSPPASAGDQCKDGALGVPFMVKGSFPK